MMKALKRSSICQLISLLAAMMFMVTSIPVPLFAQESATVQATTKITHEQIPYFVAGKRIRLAADVTDPSGIKLVRCYFKAKEQADFVFVSMEAEGNTYKAILPAPAKTASSIEYLLLAVNNKNQVVKTRQFTVNKDADESKPAPPWQDVAMEGQLKVSTELAQAPAVLEGFADSVAMDVVESSARFGFVAGGIYAVAQMAAAGGVTGTAATAVSAGTVSTTSAAGGMSGGAVAGVVAGVVVVGGAVGAGAYYATKKKDPETTCSATRVTSYGNCSWCDTNVCTNGETGTTWYTTSRGYESTHCALSNTSCINSSASATASSCFP